MLQDINSLCGKLCCARKYILRFNRGIGIGPSLFLLQVRAYICLFIVLSILSAPLSIVLSSDDYVSSMPFQNSFFKFLAQRSLGNVGPQISYACGVIDYREK